MNDDDMNDGSYLSFSRVILVILDFKDPISLSDASNFCCNSIFSLFSSRFLAIISLRNNNNDDDVDGDDDDSK